MANSSSRTVCLLGPPKGGKSSLLLTMKQCARLRSFGYAPAYMQSIDLTEITEDEFKEGFAEDDRILTRFPAGRFASDENLFRLRERSPEQSTRAHADPDDDGTRRHFFSLDCTLAPEFAENPQGDPENHRLQVVDAAGELSTASGSAGDASEPHLEKKRVTLEQVLLKTDGVVLVVPPADGQPEDWTNPLLSALDKLAQKAVRQTRLKQIVVVFSQYDRLFLRCGKDAASIAARPDTVLYVLKREVHARAWLQRFAALHHRAPTIEIRFTVASALGFVRRFGNPNIDPSAGPNDFFRFQATGPDGLDATPLWRPFMTLDPFVFAATGHAHEYMYTPENIGIVVPPEPAPAEDPVQGEAPEQPGFAEQPDNPFKTYDSGPNPAETADAQPSLLRRFFSAIRNYFIVRS